MNAKAYAETLGITYRQFDHWCRKGYVFDDPEAANPGYGYGRDISTSEAERLRCMAELVGIGLRPDAAAKLARDMSEGGTARVGGLLIVAMREAS